MKYYKLIKDKEFIGVGTSYDLRKYQLKHNILLTIDDNLAQYIQFNDKLYRDDWFSPTVTEMLEYTSVKIIVIDKDEYDILYEAIENGNEIEIPNEEPKIEEEVPKVNPDEEITVDYMKKAKISEMNYTCNKVITNGFDIVLSDDITHHFSLTTQDQLNLTTLSAMVASGETAIPYHADGEPCKYYSVDDITNIITAAKNHIAYHTTYYNSLKSYISSLRSINTISAVVYGCNIPEKYQSEVLVSLLNSNNED